MEFLRLIIGTAGHVDHGKTSLVRALTGVDTDRLKEEKARGMSIELGYAYTPLADGKVLGFVDVPGHQRLVHTMVAGVGGIDFALLVIAADDGVMPQTREHVAILRLLGINRGAVALTKIDRVDNGRIEAVKVQIATLLASSALQNAPRFPLNSMIPDDPGVAALRSYLHETAENWPAHVDDGLFRLAVDRVFTLPGRGTMVAGTARAGRVRVGDSLAVMPAGIPVRVRSIHAQNRASDIGRAGQRCALNLAGIEKTALARGDWLADARAHVPTTRIDVRLHRLAEDGALASRTLLHIHLGTAHRIARVTLLEGDTLNADSSAWAQLVFDAPVCASPGDTFIARDAQAAHTVGGGIVIDPVAPPRRRRSPERLSYLDSIRRFLNGEGLVPLLGNAPLGVEMRELARLCGRAAEQIVIPPGVRMVDAGDERFAFLEPRWLALCERASAALRAFHAQHPEEPGIDRGRLRRMTAPTVSDALWRAVIDALVQMQSVVRSGHWLHLPTHRVALNDREQTLAQKLHCAIAAGRFDPPWVRELAVTVQAADAEVRLVLRKGALQGALYQIVPDLFYHRDCVRELSHLLRELVHQHGVVDAARYRDTIGVGRKRTIQILEFFDRGGYTRRTPEGRVLRIDSGWHDDVR